MLDAYLIDNPQQHLSCMSPDSEYISLIMYATKLEIDLGNLGSTLYPLRHTEQRITICQKFATGSQRLLRQAPH